MNIEELIENILSKIDICLQVIDDKSPYEADRGESEAVNNLTNAALNLKKFSSKEVDSNE